MTDKIISTIRQKFIENINEGLFLRDDFDSFKLSIEDIQIFKEKFGGYSHDGKDRVQIILSEKDKELFNSIYRQWGWEYKFKDKEMIICDKSNPLLYLTGVLLRSRDFSYPAYNDSFSLRFEKYREVHENNLNALLKNAPKYIEAEIISDKDLLYINVKSEPRANIYIISNKYLMKIALGPNGIIERIEHIIKKDIKRLNITNDSTLEIHFHGHHDPLYIYVDDYKSALQLQRTLTELRQVNS